MGISETGNGRANYSQLSNTWLRDGSAQKKKGTRQTWNKKEKTKPQEFRRYLHQFLPAPSTQNFAKRNTKLFFRLVVLT